MPSRHERIFDELYQFTGLLEPDGTVIEVNETALEFGNLNLDDVVGERLPETYWFRRSEETRRQTREDVRRATAGEFTRHELEIQGADRTAIVDFSIRPLTDERGDVTRLVPEARDVTALKRREATAPSGDHRPPDSDLLVAYSRDAGETTSEALLAAFLALDVDVFERERPLQDCIETDSLDGFDWDADRHLALSTRLWGYRVVVTSTDVRIFTDPSVA